MKQEVFNKYVEKVSKLFSVSKEEFFSKTKKREIVDARQMVYYLCSRRHINISYIQKYMKENNYEIHHPSIIKGIQRIEEKTKEDMDYVTVIKNIENSVFI